MSLSTAPIDTKPKEGTEEEKSMLPTNENLLQKHVAFFDRNQDGLVYPWETYQGFRAIGCGIMLSFASAFLINISLSRKTRPGKSFSLQFPIEVKNIQMAKHGSDSGVYDSEGRFVPSQFEEVFKKHARTNGNALTSDELMEMLKARREPKDYNGWLAAYSEWKVLYVLCKDKNGLLQKDTIRGVYDGSLFERLEKERLSNKKEQGNIKLLHFETGQICQRSTNVGLMAARTHYIHMLFDNFTAIVMFTAQLISYLAMLQLFFKIATHISAADNHCARTIRNKTRARPAGKVQTYLGRPWKEYSLTIYMQS
ncbi:hypothetical protein ACFE04_019941 [Oxalis oulophora]